MDYPIDLSGVCLETQRLILRPWRQADLDDLYSYASVEGVGEMAGWPHHQSREESQKILDSFIAEKNVFALVLKETDHVIGSLGLHPSWAAQDDRYKHLKSKEIGYVLSKEYWGRGLMPEAVKAAISHCFFTCGVDMLTCGHFEENVQSKRVIEKCGFSFAQKNNYNVEQLQTHLSCLEYILMRPEAGR